jgi:type IV pilus assembly protein PilB
MIREEFIEVVTGTGMATLKEMRQLSLNKKADEVTEFEVLNFPHFDEHKFAKVVSEKHGLTYIDLSSAKISSDTVTMMKKRDIIKYRAIPIQKSASKITVAVFDPTVIGMQSELGQVLSKQVEYIFTNISSWKNLFGLVKESIEDLLGSIREVKADDMDADDAPVEVGDDVITYVNRVLADAFIRKTSDIHVEPYEKNFRIRFRTDGTLKTEYTPPKSMQLPIISRLKILAQLDISEKRKPQDGRIKLSVGGRPIDYRVSVCPCLFGEKVVLRLLDQSNLQLDMTKLGMEKNQIETLLDGIRKPFGMCLVTGPTGSGKTTTLYSALADLNKEGTNIATAEDPCEFNLEGINQVNVRKEIGLTFASALKSFLRQDPDVIMVGEIRDFEVGEIAIEAALTGHMVLSTLHTNDAPSTVTRLLNMGIEPFMLVAALNVCLAQRLCRRICANCKTEVKLSKDELVSVGFAPKSAEKVKVFKGAGCDQCGGKGTAGRVAIYEVLRMTPKLRELVLKGPSSDELKALAIKEGMKTLRMCALTKVAMGQTTIEEAVGNSAGDDL